MMDYSYFILVIPAFLFSLYAQFKVKGTFGKFSKVGNSNGYTGASVAREILDSNGLYDVGVEYVPGELTDHYDPRTKVVRLSETVYHSTSVAAIGVAAHETGHAIQHSEAYAPLGLRSGLIPVANIGSSAGPYLAIIGFLFRSPLMVYIGIGLFTVAVLFYLVTLPVEFNASRRAVSILSSRGILNSVEIEPTKKVLRAAAMTYIASAAVAMANLLHLIFAFSRDDD